MSELIIYTQKELNKALKDKIQTIVLCAGIYTIPPVKNTVFKRIGPVKVTVQCTAAQAETEGMVFENIYPSFKPAYAVNTRESMKVVAAVSSGSYQTSGGSYAGSGQVYRTSGGSFGTSGGSFGSGTYFYEYEFEFRSSGSMTGSYSFSYSFSYSVGGLSMLYEGSADTVCRGNTDCIYVFGYGINLI